MGTGLNRALIAGAALLCAACASTAPAPGATAAPRATTVAPAPGTASQPGGIELQAAGVIDLAGDGAPIVAHWKPLDATKTPRPAVIALHGCGGLYRRDGKTFDTRYPLYAERLHKAGYHVLLPDSFTPRGKPSICTVKRNDPTIGPETRRPDVVAAVRWLARQPNVDAKRIVLLGWSHGAITTLNAINSARTGFAAPLAGAVVFYPGCATLLRRPFKVEIPVLMLLAEKDDWTPAAPCVELADRTRTQPGVDFTMRLYPDSYHGFDGTAPVRYWTDVSNGVDAAGVHLGANPATRTQALAEMDQFLARVLK